MIDMSPVTLTDGQWAAVLDDSDFVDGYTVSDFAGVEQILVHAQDTIGFIPDDQPLRCSALTGMAVWDTSDECNEDLKLHVSVAGLELATETIKIRSFQTANDTPGELVIRTVLGELLTYRNRLLGDLGELAAKLAA